MKRKGLEEEVQTLIARFESVLKLLPDKSAAPIIKQLEILQKRVKPKKSTKGSLLKNQNSGLLKPVAVSETMAVFANWPLDELHSRVDVTKAICSYIKTNNLQKPSNKKTIIPNTILKELLQWDEEKEKVEITITDVHFNIETSEDYITYIVEHPPINGLKNIGYYNGSELHNSDKNFIALIKHVELLKTENNVDYFHALLDNIQEKIEQNNKLTLYVPLTYPKIQTKISVHLKESEKQPKPVKVKKEKPITEVTEKKKRVKKTENDGTSVKKPTKKRIVNVEV